MATTYTDILKLAKPQTGDLDGVWGAEVNNEITELVEEAIAGLAVIDTWVNNEITLASGDGTNVNNSRNAILSIRNDTATLNDIGTVNIPDSSKVYLIENTTLYDVVFTTGVVSDPAKTTATVDAGETGIIFCDGGGNVSPAAGSLPTDVVIEGTLDVNGDFTVGNDKFVVTALTGNTDIKGSLDLSGSQSVPVNRVSTDLDTQSLATDLVTALAVKNYVDNAGAESLADTLAVGNTTGGSDVIVSAGDQIQLGDQAGGDLKIYHDGSNSYIKDAGVGNLLILANDLRIRNAAGNEDMLQVDQNGAVKLSYDGVTKLTTTGTGINVTGTVDCDGIKMDDGEFAQFGTGNDLKIWHSGTNSYIQDSGDGDLNIQTNGAAIKLFDDVMSVNLASFVSGGAAKLYWAGNNAEVRLETTEAGIDVTGTVSADDQIIITGNDSQVAAQPTLTLRSNEAGSIDNQLGEITFQGHNDQQVDQTYAYMRAESPVITNNQEEGKLKFFIRKTGDAYTNTLTADSSGIDVTGTVAVSSTTADVADLRRSNSAGAGQILLGNSDGYARLSGDNGSFDVFNAGNTAQRFGVANNGDISFYGAAGTTAKVFWDASAGSLDVTGTVTADGLTLGAGKIATFNSGTGGDLQISGDATGTYSLIKQTGGGDLIIQGQLISFQNDAGGRLLATDANRCNLYWRGALGAGSKLTTEETGIAVTGTVECDEISFPSLIDDSCSIKTTLFGTSTYLDFQLKDDDQDSFRFRFDHSLNNDPAGYLTAVEIKPQIVPARDKFILDVTGRVEAESFKGTSATTITDFVTNVGSNDNNTTVPTSGAVKAYVDAASGGGVSLADTLALGNTTGSNDIHVTGNQKITFGGTSTDHLRIYEGTNGNAYVEQTGNGNLYIKGENGYLRSNSVDVASWGSLDIGLKYNGDNRLLTTNAGIAVTGTTTGNNFKHDNSNVTGDQWSSFARDGGSNALYVQQGSLSTPIASFNKGSTQAGTGTTVLLVDSTGITVAGAVTGNLTGDVTGDVTGNLTGSVTVPNGGNISLGDGEKINFGAANDLQIYFNAADSVIDYRGGSAGDMYVIGDTFRLRNSNSKDVFIQDANNITIRRWTDGATNPINRLTTNASGVNLYSEISGAGITRLLTTSTGLNIRKNDGSTNSFSITDTLATFSTPVTVQGTLIADVQMGIQALGSEGNSGNDASLVITADGPDKYAKVEMLGDNGSYIDLKNIGGNANYGLRLDHDVSSNGHSTVKSSTGDLRLVTDVGAGAVNIQHEQKNRLITSDTGVSFYGAASSAATPVARITVDNADVNLHTAYVANNATIGGTLGVTGQATFNNLTVSGTLNATVSFASIAGFATNATDATNAAKIGLTIYSGTNTSMRVLFSDATSGNATVYTDPGIKYNPIDNVLTTAVTQVRLNTTTSASLLLIPFSGTTSGGSAENATLYKDTGFNYQPSTGTLRVPKVRVDASGLVISGTTVTASAAELNRCDITTAGVVQANKVVTSNSSGDVRFPDGVSLGFGGSNGAPDTTFEQVGNDFRLGLAAGANNFLIRDLSSPTSARHQFTKNGAYIASGNITAFSDRRIKENIEVIPDALDKVSKLSGYTYDRTDKDGPRETGCIAQEILEVLPEAVMGSEDETYSVAYGNMVGLLVEAIKELKSEVEDLKAKLED